MAQRMPPGYGRERRKRLRFNPEIGRAMSPLLGEIVHKSWYVCSCCSYTYRVGPELRLAVSPLHPSWTIPTEPRLASYGGCARGVRNQAPQSIRRTGHTLGATCFLRSTLTGSKPTQSSTSGARHPRAENYAS